MVDSRDLKDLHPCLQRGAVELTKRLKDAGYPMGISSTYRDNEMQQSLYNRHDGTTQAPGGTSWHNYRLAFDIFKNIKGHGFDDITFFNKAGKIWIEMGGEWGQIVNFKGDNPHMQFTNGLTIKQLKAGQKLPQDIRMKWESVTTPQKKEEQELKSKMKVSINSGEIKEVNSILNADSNFPELRPLMDLLGVKVEYDAAKSLVKLTK